MFSHIFLNKLELTPGVPLGGLWSPGLLGDAVLGHGGAVPVLEGLAARRHPHVEGPVAAQLGQGDASEHGDS